MVDCSLANASNRGCQQCPGNGHDFSAYKWFTDPGFGPYKRKRAVACVRAISKSICGMIETMAQHSAQLSMMKMMGDEKFDPCVLPLMKRLLAKGGLHGFYVSISIDCMTDIFCKSGRFDKSMLPPLDSMLDSARKDEMYLAIESVRALFRNPGFGKGWLAPDNLNAMLKAIRAMDGKSEAEVPYPFGAFASLLASRGFSISDLPLLYGGIQSLNGMEMARYFYCLQKDRHPNAEPANKL